MKINDDLVFDRAEKDEWKTIEEIRATIERIMEVHDREGKYPRKIMLKNIICTSAMSCIQLLDMFSMNIAESFHTNALQELILIGLPDLSQSDNKELMSRFGEKIAGP